MSLQRSCNRVENCDVTLPWQGNVQKSVMQVQSCCFANKTYCVLDVLVAVARWILKSLFFLQDTVDIVGLFNGN